MKTGIELIVAERNRQITVKGWTPEHDDTHADGEILQAAGWIVNDLEHFFLNEPHAEDDPDAPWPEQLAAHVRKKYAEDDVRRLTIAGALIAAEIDRLQRAAETPATLPTVSARCPSHGTVLNAKGDCLLCQHPELDPEQM